MKKEPVRGAKIYNKNYKSDGADRNRDIRSPKVKSSTESSGTVYYIVKNGDTLFSIARRSGTTVDKLQEINHLGNRSGIYRGMKLRVPAGTRDAAPEEKKTPVKNLSGSKPVFTWPLNQVRGFTRDGNNGVKPIGIIIKGNARSEVVASESGIVKKVGYMRGYGNYIIVSHDSKYITVYSNLMGINVRPGDRVRKGGRIGVISDDRTLHFQIDRNGKPENPLKHLPVRS